MRLRIKEYLFVNKCDIWTTKNDSNDSSKPVIGLRPNNKRIKEYVIQMIQI